LRTAEAEGKLEKSFALARVDSTSKLSSFMMILKNLFDDPEVQAIAFGFAALEGREQRGTHGFGNAASVVGDGDDSFFMAKRYARMRASSMWKRANNRALREQCSDIVRKAKTLTFW
jgi:hypothetical protein